MKVAVVSGSNPTSPHVFSGTTRSIVNAIEAEFGAVSIAYPQPSKLFSLVSTAVRRVSLGRVDIWRSEIFCRIAARSVKAQLRRHRADVAVCVASSGLAAQIGRDIPSVHVSDTTFALMRDFYPAFRKLSDHTARNAEAIEQSAIRQAEIVAVSSPWAAHSVIHHYGKDASRVLTAPWGCNFAPVSREQILLRGRDDNTCRLLFVGLDWARKGGDLLIETVRELARRKFDFQIDIVGARPPAEVALPQIKVHGTLKKSEPEEAAKLEGLFRNASFMFLPTRQDCTPMVFAEANAYGVPTIAADVGGVAGVIRDGQSGRLLPANADASMFADAIQQTWSDRSRYEALRLTARETYEAEFNWSVWSKRLRTIMNQHVTAGGNGSLSAGRPGNRKSTTSDTQ